MYFILKKIAKKDNDFILKKFTQNLINKDLKYLIVKWHG